MKIGILSQWFDPEPGPAAIPGVFAREFSRAGHEVTVLTGYPNYPEGKVYPGFRQRIGRVSNVGDIAVSRVPLFPNHNSSASGRLANYASFAASATAFGRSALRDVDAVWVYNSPVTVSLPLLTHTRSGRVPYFLHVQDLWPDSLIESGMFPGGVVGLSAAAVIRRIVRLTEDRSAAVGIISPSVRDVILSRNPNISPAKITYVPNPTDETLFRPVSVYREAKKSAIDRDTFTLMYVGAIGEVQGLETLLDAAWILKARPEIRFVIVGDGIARGRLERDAADRGLSSVEFVGRIPKESVPEMMATADAQLVSLAASAFLRHTTPSKIASLLASEVPIIGQIAGDGAELLVASGAALIVDPGDAAGLAHLVESMADMSPQDRQRMAASGRNFYDRNLSAKVAAHKIVEALSGAINEY
ncbi:glycosyltransferase family 4 protein [Cryobacterium sp. PH31-AA6]|uniref:glycosyltransferase family 4 protein n=1 Tax=Cryobacterium sp. PH31-AA6 TaxID=3046205 RepID=UPI0024B89081|nr:glycosyltransferase family 4 protein [Cryobacterium sp. PH31-AA6]MDJ0323900.1 glycosyltransferase family 4 protein [Cryobacterium sp. PH31-AA6]